MEILKKATENSIFLALSGRLDTTTSPQLEAEINGIAAEVSELVMDFDKLEYVSSAGLRVILSAQKKMNSQGSMKIYNVSSEVMEIFEITGFSDILTIE